MLGDKVIDHVEGVLDVIAAATSRPAIQDSVSLVDSSNMRAVSLQLKVALLGIPIGGTPGRNDSRAAALSWRAVPQAARPQEKAPVTPTAGPFGFVEEAALTEHSRTTAGEVHALLLEAHPETNNDKLAKAAHLAETRGMPRDPRQLETFVAIRNLRTALENGEGAAELESLLLHAISTAEQWVIAPSEVGEGLSEVSLPQRRVRRRRGSCLLRPSGSSKNCRVIDSTSVWWPSCPSP